MKLLRSSIKNMGYEVIISDGAEKALSRYDAELYVRLKKAIYDLEKNPRPRGCLKMKGKNLYRIRVGEYRVIYDIQDKKLVVLIVKVGHRRDIYD